MMDFLISVLPFAFYGTVIVMALAEVVFPYRRETISVVRRWSANISLHLISSAIGKFLLPVSAAAVSISAVQAGHGLLQSVALGDTALFLAGVLLLDLWSYVAHRIFHVVRPLWRLHMVHHADVDMDFTTTERHHPLESIIGMATSLAAIYVLGVPLLAVVVYLLLTAPITVISHSNIRLSPRLDRWMRAVFVTPAFHEVHHSALKRETDSNYGAVFTFWDRLFGTHVPPEEAWQSSHDLGLEYFREPKWARIDKTLAMPFAAMPKLSTSAPSAITASEDEKDG